jgi:hypothetical protein
MMIIAFLAAKAQIKVSNEGYTSSPSHLGSKAVESEESAVELNSALMSLIRQFC